MTFQYRRASFAYMTFEKRSEESLYAYIIIHPLPEKNNDESQVIGLYYVDLAEKKKKRSNF
jgi:hypothetical protein